MSGLTQQQVTFFREEGYLLVDDAIDPAVFQPLRAELDRNVDAFARAALADGRLSDAHADEPFERRLHLLALQLDDPAPLLALGAGKQRTPGIFQIYSCPSLLDICESVIGRRSWPIPSSTCAPSGRTRTRGWCRGTRTSATCSAMRRRPSWSTSGSRWSTPPARTAAWR